MKVWLWWVSMYVHIIVCTWGSNGSRCSERLSTGLPSIPLPPSTGMDPFLTFPISHSLPTREAYKKKTLPSENTAHPSRCAGSYLTFLPPIPPTHAFRAPPVRGLSLGRVHTTPSLPTLVPQSCRCTGRPVFGPLASPQFIHPPVPPGPARL